MPASRTHLGEGDRLYLVFRESPLEVDEHRVVEAELGEAVRAEGEEDLLGLHDAAVSDLISVGMPAGRGLLLVIFHVDTAQFA